jgi:hypothetical protein
VLDQRLAPYTRSWRVGRWNCRWAMGRHQPPDMRSTEQLALLVAGGLLVPLFWGSPAPRAAGLGLGLTVILTAPAPGRFRVGRFWHPVPALCCPRRAAPTTAGFARPSFVRATHKGGGSRIAPRRTTSFCTNGCFLVIICGWTRHKRSLEANGFGY